MKFDKTAFLEKSYKLAEEIQKRQLKNFSERMDSHSSDQADLILFFFKESQDFSVEFSTQLLASLISDLEENEKSS